MRPWRPLLLLALCLAGAAPAPAQEVRLEAPAVAEVGARIAVGWSAVPPPPADSADYLTIARPGDPPTAGATHAWPRPDGSASLRLPLQPGEWELRYVADRPPAAPADPRPAGAEASGSDPSEAGLEAAGTAGPGGSGFDTAGASAVDAAPAGRESAGRAGPGSPGSGSSGSAPSGPDPVGPGAVDSALPEAGLEAAGTAGPGRSGFDAAGAGAVDAASSGRESADPAGPGLSGTGPADAGLAGSDWSGSGSGPGPSDSDSGLSALDPSGSGPTGLHPADPAPAEAALPGAGPQVLAARPLLLRDRVVTLEAPAQVGAGDAFAVRHDGPGLGADYLTIASPGTPDDAYLTYAYVGTRARVAEIVAPLVPGSYELRYVASGNVERVLGRRALQVTARPVTLAAPEAAPAGGLLQVAWSGPRNPFDYIEVARPEQPAGSGGADSYTRGGSPLRIVLPQAPGEYEIRYVLNTGDRPRILARRPLRVLEVAAALDAPPAAVQGSRLAVPWQGPAHRGDFIALVRPGDPPRASLAHAYPRPGVPLVLTLPLQPGAYELRYVARGSPGRILARQPLQITAAEVALQAPARARAGDTLDLPWQGPGNPGDRLTLARPGDPAGAALAFARLQPGRPARLTLPPQPGAYELRYLAAGRPAEVLARRPLRIEAARARLHAAAEAVEGTVLQVDWQGPAHPGDRIGLAEPGAPPDALLGWAAVVASAPAGAGPGDRVTGNHVAGDRVTGALLTGRAGPDAAGMSEEGPDGHGPGGDTQAGSETGGAEAGRAETNGAGPGGAGADDVEADSVGMDDARVDGVGADGVGADGAGVGGAGTDGAGPDGGGLGSAGQSGVDADGAGADEVGADGAETDGDGADDAGADGVGTGDAKADGAKADGAGAGGAGTDGVGSGGGGLGAVGQAGADADGAGAGEAGTDGAGAGRAGTDDAGAGGAGADGAGAGGSGAGGSGTIASGRLGLALPVGAGAYELRYLAAGRPGMVLARQPLRLTEAGASLDAPGEVGQGASFDVGFTGPAGPRDRLQILRSDAPAGAPDEVPAGASDGVTDGAFSQPPLGEAADIRADAASGAAAALPPLAVPGPRSGGTRAPAGDPASAAEPDGGPDRAGPAPRGGVLASSGPLRAGLPARLRAPLRPGAYRLRYVLGAEPRSGSGPGPRVLAEQALRVVAVPAALSAAGAAPAGADLEVTWRGPGGAQDLVVLARPGAPASEHVAQSRLRPGAPAHLPLPLQAGDYELRYLLAGAEAGADEIGAGEAGAEEGGTEAGTDKAGTDEDSTLEAGPSEARPDEVRPGAAAGEAASGAAGLDDAGSGGLPGSDRAGAGAAAGSGGARVLARRPLRLTPATAWLGAPEQAPAGGWLAVDWQGPGAVQDYLALFAPGEAEPRARAWVLAGTPLALPLPAVPGRYELAYVSGRGGVVLARRPLLLR